MEQKQEADEPKVGWYALVPANLKRRFDELYPDRGFNVKFTVAMIQGAISAAEKRLEYEQLQRRQADAAGDFTESTGRSQDGEVAREYSTESGTTSARPEDKGTTD